MKCGNRHPFKKDMGYTVVPRTVKAKLLFYVGHVLFSFLKCCILKVIPRKAEIFTVLNILSSQVL